MRKRLTAVRRAAFVLAMSIMTVRCADWFSGVGSPPTIAADPVIFRLNSHTPSDQRWPEIAVTDDGQAIVAAWSSMRQHGEGWSVIARRFDWNGKPLSGEFAPDDFRGGKWPSAEDPHIDFDSRGNHVIVWHSQNTDENDGGWTVFARRYRAEGTPFGPGKKVPTTTKYDQWRPTVMVSSNGATIVTWYAEHPGADGEPVSAIKGRALNARDEFVGDEFPISGPGELRRLQWRQGAVNRAGRFASFWYVEKPSMTGFLRMLDSTGAARSDELQFPDFVNAGIRQNGDALVSFGGKGQWLDSSGRTIGLPIPLRAGEIAMNDEGAFVVIVVEQGRQGHGLYAYPYDRDGRQLPEPILLTRGHANLGGPPHVDLSENGVIAATWEEGGATDGDGSSVWGAIALHPSYRR